MFRNVVSVKRVRDTVSGHISLSAYEQVATSRFMCKDHQKQCSKTPKQNTTSISISSVASVASTVSAAVVAAGIATTAASTTAAALAAALGTGGGARVLALRPPLVGDEDEQVVQPRGQRCDRDRVRTRSGQLPVLPPPSLIGYPRLLPWPCRLPPCLLQSQPEAAEGVEESAKERRERGANGLDAVS